MKFLPTFGNSRGNECRFDPLGPFAGVCCRTACKPTAGVVKKGRSGPAASEVDGKACIAFGVCKIGPQRLTLNLGRKVRCYSCCSDYSLLLPSRQQALSLEVYASDLERRNIKQAIKYWIETRPPPSSPTDSEGNAWGAARHGIHPTIFI